MKKKRVISIAVILGILACAAVFAAQILSEVSKSTVTASNLDVKLVMLEEQNGTEVAAPKDTTIMPGVEISKIARVKNTGKEGSWIRVKANLLINGGSIPAAEDNDYIELLGVNDSDWTYNEDDGYWYYNEPLKSGETSEALFTGVKFTDDEDLIEGVDDSNLEVEAEGTQVKNNGSTVFEAQGWPSN